MPKLQNIVKSGIGYQVCADFWHFHPYDGKVSANPFMCQVTYKIMQADIMPGSKLTENVKSHPKVDNQFQDFAI